MSELSIVTEPLSVQLSLGTGYLSYCIAYYGIRSHHKALDAALTTILFSIIATFLIFILEYLNLDRKISILIACTITLITSFAWRKFGNNLSGKLLSFFNSNWSDETPSSLFKIAHDTTKYTLQIVVKLEDGTLLHCNDTQKYSNAPFNPILIGDNGDIAFYLTEIKKPDGTIIPIEHTIDENRGCMITYIPANRIQYIQLRHKNMSDMNSLPEHKSSD